MARALTLLLALVLILGSVSGILLETRFKGDPRAEQFFCRFWLCSDRSLATRASEKLAQGGSENQAEAVKLFQQVLERDKVNPYRWCDLGDALVETGQQDRARACFEKALELGPHVPPVLMRVANFYFQIGDAESALPSTSLVLKMAPDYDQVIFSSYRRMNMPAADVLATGIPPDKRAAQSYLRYLLANAAPVADAELAWNWLAARSYTDDPLASEYLDFLIRNRRYSMASDTWAKHLGKRRDDFLKPDRLFNGGFENEFTGAALDWRVSPIDGVDAARESSGSHRGKFCLRIQFDGQSNVNYSHVTQTVQAGPGAYRFQAFAKSESLTTDQGVAFRIYDAEAPGRLDVRTEPLLGTQAWTKIEKAIFVPPGTNLLNVQIVRPSSMKFDCKINGTVWFDDVSLTPLR